MIIYLINLLTYFRNRCPNNPDKTAENEWKTTKGNARKPFPHPTCFANNQLTWNGAYFSEIIEQQTSDYLKRMKPTMYVPINKK